MERYEEARFRRNIDAALQSIRTILDHTKNPCYPEDVPHRYEDKFLLAEFLTRTATVAVLQGLGALGLSSEGLAKLLAWSRIHPVTLRFTAEERCKFLREETRQEESTQQHTIEKRSLQGGNTTTTAKIITTVKEYFWSFEFSYELVAYQGNHLETQVLRRRSGQLELRTSARTAPRPESVIRPPLDVNLSWLLGQIDGEQRASFSIDRTDPACHTPRRNPPVESALEALRALASWCSLVHSYFLRDLFPVHTEHSLDLSAISAEGVFVPVVPVFEMTHEAVGERSAAYAGSFLEEQQRSLTNRFAQIAKIFPQEGLITSADAALLVTLLHLIEVAQHHADGVDYIEAMLRNQLIAAIGKELTPADFSAYMNFHQRKLFRPEHRPLPFSVTIRRPEHSPEGVLSIEATQGGITAPICTSCARSEARSPMYFPLDAATRVPFLGERYLHGWIAYQFSGQQSLTLNLVARARQFSSFLLLVGRIASADTFEPRHGIILQNKDLLKIPLLLEPIPTPKEFRDAIASLSPEQQQFARAFRAMQLESTLFAVCIVQIKPQLEALLNLPPDSLTKEIKLTQDLLSLFIDYQIPSDLISYDGRADASPEHKLARVHEHVAKMLTMIAQSRAREIDEAREQEKLRLAESNMTPYGPMPPPSPLAVLSFATPALGGTSQSRREAECLEAMPPMAPPSLGAPPPPAAPPPPPSPARKAAPRPAPGQVSTTAAAPLPPAAPKLHQTPFPRTREAPPTEPGDLTDYTRIPAVLDRRFEEIDEDAALRPTLLNPGDPWKKTAQKGLLSEPVTTTLGGKEQETEKNKAFDLLDALSRSGTLPIHHASLHVVLAATHCFDQTLIDTVIQGNVNPIEKVERSLMIMATTIHNRPAAELIAPDQQERFFSASPQLLKEPLQPPLPNGQE